MSDTVAAIEKEIRTSRNEDLYESFRIQAEEGGYRTLLSGYFTAVSFDRETELFTVELVQDEDMWITAFVPQATMELIDVPATGFLRGWYDIVMEFTGPRRKRVQAGPILISTGESQWPTP